MKKTFTNSKQDVKLLSNKIKMFLVNHRFVGDLWKELKDMGNPKEGRIIRVIFKEIFHRIFREESKRRKLGDEDIKESLLDDIFDRNTDKD